MMNIELFQSKMFVMSYFCHGIRTAAFDRKSFDQKLFDRTEIAKFAINFQCF